MKRHADLSRFHLLTLLGASHNVWKLLTQTSDDALRFLFVSGSARAKVLTYNGDG